MTLAQVMEHIRALLREPLSYSSTLSTYTDNDLKDQVPTALRTLRSLGVAILTTAISGSAFDVDPTENQGVLMSLRIASVLLRGDLTKRVLSGAAGMVFRMGNDLIDTKTAAIEFAKIASSYEVEYRTLLTMELSAETEPFGTPDAPAS